MRDTTRQCNSHDTYLHIPSRMTEKLLTGTLSLNTNKQTNISTYLQNVGDIDDFQSSKLYLILYLWVLHDVRKPPC